jgi:uncharacterized protein involved in outer membrane biogenesis
MPTWIKRRRVWIPAALALAVALYAAAGFWWAPHLVRDAIVERGSASMGVPVSVGEVQVHPFTFEMTVRDVAVADPAQPLLAFERLYVDFELSSLWQRAWVFETVRLNGPFARAIIRPDGSLNLADLVPESDPAAADEPLPAVWIRRLVVARGQVNFADRSRRMQPERRMAPIAFDLADFRTTPEGGGFKLTAASESGERFDWQGRLSLQPVASSGTFAIKGLQARGVWEFVSEQLPFELSQGEFDLAGDYDFRLNEPMQLEATLPRITATGLALRAAGEEAAWVTLPSVQVQGTRLSLAAGTVAVDAVEVSGARITAWRDADGGINLERLLAAAADSAAPAASVVPAAPAAPEVTGKSPSPSPWQVTLKRFALTDGHVAFEDRAVQPAVAFELAPLSVQASGLGLDLSKPVPVRVEATVDGAATLRAEGSLVPGTVAGEFDVALAGLSLPKLQPYLEDVVAVDVTAGTFAAAGKATLAAPDAAPWLRFSGEASVAGLRAVDHAQKQELATWKQLDLAGVELALAPESLRVRRMTLRQPFLRAEVDANQSVNLLRVISPAATVAAATPAPVTAKPLAAASAEPLPPVRIDEIVLQSATLDFADYNIQPNFRARVESLDGSIRGLSTAPGSRAKVDLKGFVVNKFSPVTIQGELNPFRYDQHTDLKLAFRNIDLPVFNPYSGRYAGFAIAKGKLTTELDYTIRDRRLVAGHHVVVDQLEWGEETDSQEKVSLPIRLATSLLKDRNGVIDLNLPVEGTLDDPTFRVGPVVWQIVRNLVVKIVTAPFAFLGSLFEGAEDAQFVVFEPGEGALTAEQQQALSALAKGLAERPQLRIEVPAGMVPELDVAAITRRGLTAALAEQHGAAADAAFTLEALEPDDQVDLLRDLYRERFGQRPKIPDPPEPPEDADRAARRALAQAHEAAWLTDALLPRFAPSDAELAALAQARAEAVQSALLSGGELLPERVFITGVAPVAPKEGRVSLELAVK